MPFIETVTKKGTTTIYRFLRFSALQAIGVLAVASVLGIFINLLRNDGIPLMPEKARAPEVILHSGQNIALSFSATKDFFFSQEAVFIDSRSEVFFNSGHIKGALNLPWKEFDSVWERVVGNIDKETLLVIYCDGVKCPLSKNVAQELLRRGFKNVKVFPDGWKLWTKSNLPVEKKTM